MASSASLARPSPTFWARWGDYLNELSATVLLCALAFSTDAINPNNTTPFIERDPTFSFALKEGMSLGLLIVISVVIPLVVITLCCLADYLCGRVVCLRRLRGKSHLGGSFQAHLFHFGFVVLGLAQALMATKLVTDAIKLAARVQRPNFFALCDYAGYRDAAATGNFNSYWNNTTAGVFGEQSKCQGTPSQIREAQLSFPSGHSSNSFAGMVFLVYFLRAFFGVRRSYFFNWASFVTALPLVLAAYTAISRIRDRWHSTTDVSVGAFIGILGATWGWRNYASLERSMFKVVRQANAEGNGGVANGEEAGVTASLLVKGGLGAAASLDASGTNVSATGTPFLPPVAVQVSLASGLSRNGSAANNSNGGASSSAPL